MIPRLNLKLKKSTLILYTRDTITKHMYTIFSLFNSISHAHSHRLSGHPGDEKTDATIIDLYLFPNINTWIAILTNDFLNRQTSNSMPNLLTAPEQPFIEFSSYFIHLISMDTKGPTSPPSDKKSYVYVIIDAFAHYVFFQPTPEMMQQMH